MNDFKKGLEVNNEEKKEIEFEKFDEKVAQAIYMAILDIKPQGQDEEMRRIEMLHNFNRIIHNYDEVMRVLKGEQDKTTKKFR